MSAGDFSEAHIGGFDISEAHLGGFDISTDPDSILGYGTLNTTRSIGDIKRLAILHVGT